jgi:carboxylesterase type B
MIETIMASNPNNTGGGAPGDGGPPGGPDPRESEDCLLLDVMVPQAVFNMDVTPKKGVPVLVWIHGGGFTSGSKSDVDSAGLIAQSMRDGRQGVIIVTINYRL